VSTGVALEIERPGDLTSLALLPRARRAPGPGEIEVRVEAAGLNFADVLLAFGRRPAVESGSPPLLGLDCAGTVERVGEAAPGFRPGDRVMLFGEGCFASHITVAADLAALIAPRLSFAEAATVPVAFLTAWYALVHRGALAPGESVLIHSAAGGVGSAAVQVARMLGARVLATAGTEDKRRHLRETGICDVWNSRALDFGDGVRAATGGQGVDVVLNSLSGDALRAGLEALRVQGRFLEIGKHDIYAGTPVSLLPFRRNISLHSIDLLLLGQVDPGLIRRLNAELAAPLTDGRLGPVPYVTYPFEDAAAAFRAMAGGRLMGKVVLIPKSEGVT